MQHPNPNPTMNKQTRQMHSLTCEYFKGYRILTLKHPFQSQVYVNQFRMLNAQMKLKTFAQLEMIIPVRTIWNVVTLAVNLIV